MGKVRVAACVVWLASLTAFAESPKAVIDGPSSVRVAGQKLVLRASDKTIATSKGYRWTISPELKGYEQLTVQDGGKAVLVHTLPGRYVVTLVVAGAPDADGQIEIDSITHDLTIPGEAPCPPPEPTPTPVDPVKPVPPVPQPQPQPNPPPTPPAPPVPPAPKPPTPVDPSGPVPMGEFGLAPAVYDAAVRTGDKAGAKKLADAARKLAEDIKAGKVASVQEIINQIAKSLKEGGQAWQALLTLTKTAIQTLIASGKLDATDVHAWARMLREIADALDAAAK